MMTYFKLKMLSDMIKKASIILLTFHLFIGFGLYAYTETGTLSSDMLNLPVSKYDITEAIEDPDGLIETLPEQKGDEIDIQADLEEIEHEFELFHAASAMGVEVNDILRNISRLGIFNNDEGEGQFCLKDFSSALPVDQLEFQSQMLAKAGIVNSIPDIPVFTNKKIQAFIHLYTVRKRDQFQKAINRSAKYMRMMNRIFAEYGLPSNLVYLSVVESNLNPKARSKANAVGMWQFMSYTGKVFGLHRSWWHDERYDPEKSTVAAAKYLKQLNRQFKGDWELALAAYNSGGGRVRGAIRRNKRRGKPTDYWNLRLPRETRGYVPAFYAVVTIFNNLEKYGFEPAPNWEEEIPRQFVEVPGGVTFKQVANALQIKSEVLKPLNINLPKNLTPATFKTFKIAIPGHIELSSEQHARLVSLNRVSQKFWKYHKVRRGDTLWSISQKYQVPIHKIKSFNQFKRRNFLKIGQKIMLPVPRNWVPKKSKTLSLADRIAALEKIPGTTFVHLVRKGETLWNIAMKYNLSIKKIKRWNRPVLRGRLLKIGTRLVLKLPEVVASNP